MKKAASIICLAMCLVIIMSQVCFAAGLEVTNISPKDGETGKQVLNMAVKITFSEDMMDEDAIAANADKIRIVDSEGNDVPFEIVYSSEKYPDQLWLILKETLNSNTEYTVELLPGLVSTSGSTLGQKVTSSFKTRNTRNDSYVSMAMMAGMMAVMFLSTKQAMKKADAENTSKKPAAVYEEMNPYKLAKEKNISVDEARRIIDSRREKQAKAAAKADASRSKKDDALAAEVAAQQKRLEEEMEAERRANNYHVKRSGSMVSRGYECPKAVVRMNRKKRQAAEKAAKKAAAKKGKK